MSESSSENLKTEIRSLENTLFSKELFTIPPYQRPYKWSAKNVNQLIDDVLLHNDKSAYRLGTVVVHRNGSLNIVDGQQRLYTLSLLAAELLKTEIGGRLMTNKTDELCLSKSIISHPVSLDNLKRNHKQIKERVHEFQRDDILFFFQKCELVYIELDDISEAFQFFDSQNTRGKDLAPHDLLKAFHLREMAENTEAERIACVDHWEDISEELPNFFSNYLFRIRRWSRGKSGLYFSKKNVDTFKGITVNSFPNQFNYTQSYRVNHFFTESYNRDTVRNIDGQKLEYPFQLDQVIINGKRFFEFVHHYAGYIRQIENLYDERLLKSSLAKQITSENRLAKDILHVLRTYKGRGRQGDLYVRNLFDCCFLHYWDKFGLYKLDEAIIKFFLWAFALRLERQAVQEVAADNLATAHDGFFRIIREAIHPREILQKQIKPADYVGDDKAVSHIEPIVAFFTDLNQIQKQ
jgi:hypothetical protein